MKILNLCTYDRQAGGAAEVAWRLFRGLRDMGQTSRLLVQQRFSGDPDVIRAGSRVEQALAPLRFHLDAVLLRVRYPHRAPSPWSPAWLPGPAARSANRLAPDVVHVHWGGHGFVPARSLPAFDAPLVWTLHDAWAFTGGCHLPGDCARHAGSCGACPQLGSRREEDLSRLIWLRKEEAWRETRVAFVAPSRWMAGVARSSRMLAKTRIEVIPNGLDTEFFRPRENIAARQSLGLPEDRMLIACVAMHATRDPHKGFDLLAAALRALPTEARARALLVVAGDRGQGPVPETGVPVRFLGPLRTDEQLAALYAASDVLASPSRVENLSCVVAEAMACGIPVVAFRVGGNADLVDHGVTGLLAEAFDIDALAEHLKDLLMNKERRCAMGSAARSKALCEFDMDTFLRRHIALYEDLIAERA